MTTVYFKKLTDQLTIDDLRRVADFLETKKKDTYGVCKIRKRVDIFDKFGDKIATI